MRLYRCVIQTEGSAREIDNLISNDVRETDTPNQAHQDEFTFAEHHEDSG